MNADKLRLQRVAMRRLFARLRGLRGIAAPLLGSSYDNRANVEDVEMLENSLDSDRLSGVEVYVVSSPVSKSLSLWALVVLVVLVGAGASTLLLNEWVQNPNQRGWLLLASAFYVLASMKHLWNEIQRNWTETMNLQACIDRRSSMNLFEGITDSVEKECT